MSNGIPVCTTCELESLLGMTTRRLGLCFPEADWLLSSRLDRFWWRATGVGIGLELGGGAGEVERRALVEVWVTETTINMVSTIWL